MTLKETLLKNSAWLFVGEISDKILSYPLIILLARMLGDVGLGEYSFVFAAVQMTFLLSDMGVGSYMIRETSRHPERTQELFSNAVLLKFILNFLGLLATIIFTLVTHKPNYIMISMLLLSARMILQNWGSLFEVVFQSTNKMQFVTGGKILERITALLLGGYILLNGGSLVTFFAALFFAYVLKFFYQGIFFLRKNEKLRMTYDFKIMKELLMGGVPLWLTGVFAFIYFRIDIIMLSLMVNDQVVGWYSAAYKLIDALNFIPYIVFVASFPSMSKLFVEDKTLLITLLNRVIRYLLYLAIPIATGTILLSERILKFIYGNSFNNSAIALQILIVAETLVFVTYILGITMNAINKEKQFTLVVVFLSLFNIFFNFIFIPKYTYVGAAVTTLVTEVLNLVMLSILISRYVGRIKYEIIKPIIASGLMAASIYFSSSLAIWWIFILAVIVYAFSLFLLGIKTEDKELAKAIVQKIQSLKATI